MVFAQGIQRGRAVEDRVKKILVGHLGMEEYLIKPETTLGDMGADSLDFVELVMAFEDEFEIEITDEKAEKINTFQDMIHAVNQELLDG